jgi:hypothetical protein
VGTSGEQVASFFLQAHPALKAPSTVVYTAAASERCRIVTTATGTVHARVEQLFRFMEAYGVEW